jgi:hypothetical protein
MRHEPQTLDTQRLGLFPSQAASLGELPVQEVRPSKGYSHTSAEASRVLRFRASKFRPKSLKQEKKCRRRCDGCRQTGSSKLGLVLEEKMMRGLSAGRRNDKSIKRPAARTSLDAGSTGGVYPAPQFDTAIKRRRFTRSAVWSGREDSNLRPLRPERSALPGCATPRQHQQNSKASGDCLTSWGRNASHGHRPPPDR